MRSLIFPFSGVNDYCYVTVIVSGHFIEGQNVLEITDMVNLTRKALNIIALPHVL